MAGARESTAEAPTLLGLLLSAQHCIGQRLLERAAHESSLQCRVAETGERLAARERHGEPLDRLPFPRTCGSSVFSPWCHVEQIRRGARSILVLAMSASAVIIALSLARHATPDYPILVTVHLVTVEGLGRSSAPRKATCWWPDKWRPLLG
jgi:hypothetical protein